MHTKWKWIGLGILAWGCQVSTAISPQPTPSISTSPLMPSNRPSEKPSPTPSPSPLESSKPIPLPPEVAGLRPYNLLANVYCAPETVSQQQPVPSLSTLSDFAIHADGTEAYLLYGQRQVLQTLGTNSEAPTPLDLPTLLGYNPCWQNQDGEGCPVRVITRQGFYRLNTQGTLQPIQLQNSEAFSCGYSAQLEKDHANRLLVHMPLRLTRPAGLLNPIIGHTLIEWDLRTNQAQEKWRYQIEPDITPTATSEPRPMDGQLREMNNLYAQLTGNDTQAYYSLSSNEANVSGAEINKLVFNTKPPVRDLQVKTQVGWIRSFAVLNNQQISVNYWLAPIPYPLYGPQYYTESWEKIYQNSNAPVLNEPNSMRVSANNVLYFVEYNRGHSIWKVDLVTKSLSRLAGNDQPGYQDGPGNTARFNQPDKLDLDAAGNVYVFDKGNLAIRKITPSGQVSTFYKEEPHAH